ncbi:degenerate transposase (orf2) [Streptococcus pneumoniae]|nr:degenerate transposase (orf2) [Streptococcus pneumoniae]
MSFIAQDFNNLNIITVLEGRTQAVIRDHFLKYDHYQIYQLLLFHFQNKDPEKFFGLIEDNLKQVHPIFQTVFKTFLKNKEKIVNALQLPYSNAKIGSDQ